MDNRNPAEKPTTTATEPKKKSAKALDPTTQIKLPEEVIQTIEDMIDAYLKGNFASKWVSYTRSAKEWINSFSKGLGFSPVFQDLTEDRKLFCQELKRSIRATDMASHSKTIIALGENADIAYQEAQFSYSMFFLFGHAIRNIMVSHLKNLYPVQYNGLLEEKIKKLKETKHQEQDVALVSGEETTHINKQRKLQEKHLAFLEHPKSIWRMFGEYKNFDQPSLLPIRTVNNKNHRFFLQWDFADQFFDSALSPTPKFAKNSLAQYIQNKRLEIQKYQSHRPNQ